MVELLVAWRKDRTSPLAANFVELLLKMKPASVARRRA
jgi:hypothetical protein